MEPEHAAYNSTIINVPPEFTAVFSHFYSATNNTAQTVRKTLVPHYQTIMVFSFGSDLLLHSSPEHSIPVSRCMVLGPVKQSLHYSMPPGSDMLVANFKEDAFHRFFGQIMLWGQQPLHPDVIIGTNCFTGLWQALNSLKEAERVNYILSFCRPYLKERSNILQQIAGTAAQTWLNPVKTVASGTGRTVRSVQQHFKKFLGYSAKEINRYQRFIKAVAMIQAFAVQSVRADWFEILEQCGYYDQSQLAHDFKHYMNITPTQFLKLQEDICVAGQS